MSDWNKFSNLVSNENVNLIELQIYIDTLGPSNNQLTPLLMQSQQQPSSIDKKEPYNAHSSVYSRKKEENLALGNKDGNFNPSKTFGG